ncbi:glycosyl hydrolase family 28 protein [Nonomuraea angiospora]|uniref:glycosyl hydrolase family 28 protein n=1 Tax=Nonomuraea angiospora TaxID=46172 RepID=UPI0029A03D69|nr:glycosyl hydrolase family 28 protein [Nonomuraea angiospora]MDX3102871.1 glycosyl hydrolase family 28 protein [Nonomuraea angiospora]
MTISRRDLIKAGGALLVGTGTTGGPTYAESVAPGAAGSATTTATTGTTGTTAAATSASMAASPWDRVPEILARIVPPAFPDRAFPITDYGAKPDNSTDCTAAFRDAIAACNAAGGGRVVVPSGTFRTGKIHLLSNVNLQVNGTIRFRTDPGSYLPTVFTRWEGIECYNYSPFIYANGQTNVAITGTGTIDGNAPAGDWSSWGSGGADRDQLREWGADDHPVAQRQFGSGHKLRPNLIGLYNCTAVLVEGVNLRNPAMWTLHPVYCTNVTVRNVTFSSTNSQGDGCDPDSCTDVLIIGCKFDTNDDCVPVKSGRDRDGRRVNRPSQNIVIQNCKFSGRWGGVTIGSEMSGGVRDVFAEDCECNAPDFPGRYPVKYALYVKTSFNRGGFVDGVHLRRITGHDLERSALYVTLNYETSGSLPPVVQNFTADGLTIDGAAQAYNLDGRPTDHIKNVTISNSTFTGITTATPTASNVDNLVLSGVLVNGKDISNTAGTRYEAENATIFQGAAESNHAGYSGTGFVNTDNVAGAYVEFAVSAAAAGSRTLTIRYANGTSTNRPFAVTVNGAAAGSAVNAPGTGAWTTWVSTSVTVPLVPGANAVRLTATTAGGLPNLDYVELQP